MQFTQRMLSVDHVFIHHMLVINVYVTDKSFLVKKNFFADFQYSANKKYKDFFQSLVAFPDNICYHLNAMPWLFLV